MQLVSITCIKNEIDIAEAFVRHALSHVDRMIVLDTGSTDGTRELLERLRDSGLPIDLSIDLDPDYLQAQRLTSMMKDAVATHGADWVVPLDSDEFPMVPESETLRSCLSRVSLDTLVRIPWTTYVPRPGDRIQEKNPAIRITHHLVKEAWPWTKIVIPRTFGEHSAVKLSLGSHYIELNGEVHRGIDLEGVGLAHIPLRSPGQYAIKVLMGYLGFSTTPGIPSGAGFQYSEPFELLKSRPYLLADRLYRDAMHFAAYNGEGFVPEIVDDPLRYGGGPLEMTPDIDDWERAMSTAVNLAERYARRTADSANRS